MKAIKICLLVASASTMSSDASSVNGRMRLRGVEKPANESQRQVQEKGEKKSVVAKESSVKEIANEIHEVDEKIIKEEEKLIDEKSVQEHFKELKHAKKVKGEKDVVNKLTADLKPIEFVIEADEKQLKKDKSVKEELKKEKKEKKVKAKEEKIFKDEKAEEEKVKEEMVESGQVKEEIAFEELEDLETETDSITNVNSKFLDTDNIETVVSSSKPTAKPTTSPSVTPTLVTTELPTFSPTLAPSDLVVKVEVDPMPNPTCPPGYDITKTTYVGGEMVLITDNIFECYTLYAYYCNIATWDDALLTSDPNAEEAWNSAWVYVGSCS